MKAFGEAVGLLLAIAVICWVVVTWMSPADRKPVVACKPLYWLASGLQRGSAAAVSTTAASGAPNAAHAPQARDAATGRQMPVSDRLALGCLRFTDRLFNR